MDTIELINFTRLKINIKKNKCTLLQKNINKYEDMENLKEHISKFHLLKRSTLIILI